MGNHVVRCHSWWCCAPRKVRWTVLAVLFVLEFPIVHTFWNIVGFEGFYANG